MRKWNTEEVEEQILLLLDKELSAEQAAAVWAQIETFPEYNALYEEFVSVYLEPEESQINFSYLQKEEDEKAATPMKLKKQWRPVWGIAAGIAIVATTTFALWQMNNNEHSLDHQIVKSDKLSQNYSTPLQQLAQDSLNNKAKQHEAGSKSEKPKQQTVKVKTEAGLAKKVIETPEIKNPVVEASLATNMYSKIETISSNAPKIDSNIAFDASIDDNSLANIAEEISNDAKGLFPEILKAGQWIFGERKQSTTVEIAIGNKESKTIKLKF